SAPEVEGARRCTQRLRIGNQARSTGEASESAAGPSLLFLGSTRVHVVCPKAGWTDQQRRPCRRPDEGPDRVETRHERQRAAHLTDRSAAVSRPRRVPEAKTLLLARTAALFRSGCRQRAVLESR